MADRQTEANSGQRETLPPSATPPATSPGHVPPSVPSNPGNTAAYRQSTPAAESTNGVQALAPAQSNSPTQPHVPNASTRPHFQDPHDTTHDHTNQPHTNPQHSHHLASDIISAVEHGYGVAADGLRRANSSGHVMRQHLWDRFRGKGRRKIGWAESAKNVALSSYLNLFLIFVPLAWASHFVHEENFHNESLTFAFSFLSIIPLEKLFDYGGEQMSFYVGRDLGDLIIVTLNNAVEATLAIILLFNCELRILQATIIGVVLLHLLLVPGTAFLCGGARIWEQNLHPHPTQLNHTLLTIGVLSLLIPSAFFSSLDRGESDAELTSDATRLEFLQMSRGLSIILLCIYVASRIFLHNPPGEGNAFRTAPNAPKEIHDHEKHLATAEPEVNPWFCVVFLVITIAIMATTAEWLVKSVESVRDQGMIREEWFGLILLPIVSFSADGVVAVVYFIRALLFQHPEPPMTIAKARAIDLSIQFTLFWMPFLVLLSWWSGRTLSLLFDIYEVALILGACFLVNYVTADNKTNWVEGFVMVSFYIMIALCSWFYPGQESITLLLQTGRCADIHGGGAGEVAAGGAIEGH